MQARPSVPTAALTALLALTLLGGCASSPVASIERNPELSLADAETFGWFDPLGTDRAEYESFVTMRLKRAIAAALERKGLTYRAEDPDVRVNFYVNLEQRQDVRSVPAAPASRAMGMDFFGYRAGLYAPWPAYQLAVTEYRQGTLSVDVVDAPSGRLAWAGVLEGRVPERSLREEEEALRDALEELFARFP